MFEFINSFLTIVASTIAKCVFTGMICFQGLEHLHPTLASEPKGVSLVSDGAEVIRISKRFFLLHAKNNTMLRVETMVRFD